MKKDRLWDEIETAYATRKVQPVPDSWTTASDYSKRTGMTASSASNKLKQMAEAGYLERKEWPAPTGIGSKIFIYRPKKK